MTTQLTTPVRRTGEPRLASVASWAVLAASFGLSASTWIELAIVAGFTDHLTIHGVTVHMSWLMPVAVDGYVVVALVLWMAPVPPRVAAFAKKNTYGAAGVGIVAQSAYHLLFTLSTTQEIWRVVLAAIVGAVPPAVAGLAVHMRALIRRESDLPQSAYQFGPTESTRPSTSDISARPASEPARPQPIPEPPAPVTVAAVPTPAVVAARITPARPVIPTAPATVVPSGPRPTRTRPNRAAASSAPKLAPSTIDIPVSESDAAQLSLPVVPADLLDRAATVAGDYQTEHGAPITAGQLAVRLKVTSELAAHILAHTTNPMTPTVNGRPIKAAR